MVAQGGIEYEYDAAGNRIRRSIEVLRIASDTSGNGVEQANHLSKEMGVSVYPNPVQNTLSITISNLPNDEVVAIYLYDITGKSIYTNENASQINSIDFSILRPGLYHVKILIGSRELYYKIMKS